MSRSIRLVSAAGVVLTLAVASGCSGGSGVNVGGAGSSNGGSGSSNGGSSAGGVLQAAIGGEPDQLDPQKTSAYYSFEVLENVYDTLVQPDANLNMQPALATSWDTSKDQLTWTFHLGKGLTFSDGTPLTSKDVVYSFERIIKNKLNSSYKFTTVKSITAPDPATVVFTLNAPTPNMLANVGGFKGVGIVEQSNVDSGKIKTAPVGSGPFMVKNYVSGDKIELVPNPHYWGTKPKLAGVTYTFVKDPTVALQDLQSGQVQWTDNLPPQQVASLKNNSDISVQSAPSTDYWYMALNETHKPFDNPQVRRAVAFALDREAITKVATFGNATVNQAAIPKGSQWYFEYAPYTHDPAKAQQLMSQAGVKNASMDLMVTSQYPESVRAAQVIASELGAIGINVKIRTLDFAQWLDEEGKGNFDSFMLGWLGNLDPDEFYYAQHHSGANFNFQKYSNPSVDKLLDQARTETDQKARKQEYDQAAKMIVDDASYIYLYNPDVVQGWSKKVTGYQVRPDRAIRFGQTSLTQ